MLSSQITPTAARPVSSLSNVHYRQVDKSVADAQGRSRAAFLRAPLRPDRSMHEFQGDRTYLDYLSRGA